jgi:hypothetical protein
MQPLAIAGFMLMFAAQIIMCVVIYLMRQLETFDMVPQAYNYTMTTALLIFFIGLLILLFTGITPQDDNISKNID